MPVTWSDEKLILLYYIAPARDRTHDLPHAAASNMIKVSYALTTRPRRHTHHVKVIHVGRSSLGVATLSVKDGGDKTLAHRLYRVLASMSTDISTSLHSAVSSICR